MQQDKFKPKNTGVEFDESEYITCGPVHTMHYYTDDKYFRSIKLRKILSDEDCNIEGVWIEDGWVIPIYDEELEEGGRIGLEALGPFMKSFQVSLKGQGRNFIISITEYENYCMVDVNADSINIQAETVSDKLFSKYIRSVHAGNIQNSIIKLKTDKDVIEFVGLLKELS